jgi:hypothetical protein
MPRAATSVLLSLLLSSVSAGQATNLELFQEMAVECLGGVPIGADTLLLEAPETMPYLRSALTNLWKEDERTIFLADSSAVPLPLLAYRIENSDVEYARRGKQIERRLKLDIRFTYTDRNGRLMSDDRCSAVRTGPVAMSDMAQIQDAAYPETQAEMPEAGWFRRYLEPVVLTAATAVAVYLFFTLRSNAGDS